MDFGCIGLHFAHCLRSRIHARADTDSAGTNIEFYRDTSHHAAAKRHIQATDSFTNYSCANQNHNFYPNS